MSDLTQGPGNPPGRFDLSGRDDQVGINSRLNDALPRKRAICQGLLRNTAGDLLLCELTYKPEWDLPGGVVDPDESPAMCLARECHEELGLDLTVGALRAVNWLPAYRGWDDAILFLFDLTSPEPVTRESMTLLPRELRDVHWAPDAAVGDHVAPYTAAMVEAVTAYGAGTVYLENSVPVQVAR